MIHSELVAPRQSCDVRRETQIFRLAKSGSDGPPLQPAQTVRKLVSVSLSQIEDEIIRTVIHPFRRKRGHPRLGAVTVECLTKKRGKKTSFTIGVTALNSKLLLLCQTQPHKNYPPPPSPITIARPPKSDTHKLDRVLQRICTNSLNTSRGRGKRRGLRIENWRVDDSVCWFY